MAKTYSTIDVFKFLFCIMIIAVHTRVATILPSTVEYSIRMVLFRLAVPFFFIASGFFLGEKLRKVDVKEQTRIILTYCKRLLVPLIVFEVINLIELNVGMIWKGRTLPWILLWDIKSIIFYPRGALWFVQACIIGALLLLPFLRYKKMLLALSLGCVLNCFALICNNYFFIVEGTAIENIVKGYMSLCYTARNGLFVGFVMLTIGVCCSYYRERISKRQTLILSMIFFALNIVEIVFLYDKHHIDDEALLITHLLFTPVLFMLLLQIPCNIKSENSILMRNLSTGMYFLHKPVMPILCLFPHNVVSMFILTTLVSATICIFAYKTKFLRLDRLLK